MAISNEGNLITEALTITGTGGNWQDVKTSGAGETESLDYSFFTSFIELDINDSLNVQFRYVGLYVTGGLEFILPLKTIKKDKILLDAVPFEINSDSDQNILVATEIDQTVPIIKLQVQALTLGGTAGIITSATYRQGYRQ